MTEENEALPPLPSLKGNDNSIRRRDPDFSSLSSPIIEVDGNEKSQELLDEGVEEDRTEESDNISDAKSIGEKDDSVDHEASDEGVESNAEPVGEKDDSVNHETSDDGVEKDDDVEEEYSNWWIINFFRQITQYLKHFFTRFF